MIKALKKKVYFCSFSVWKYFKFPTCSLRTNYILPPVSLGKGIIVEEGVRIYGRVQIGSYTFINENSRIDPNTKSIGRYCSISHGVKIGVGPHPLDRVSTSPLFYSSGRGLVSKDSYDEFGDKGYTEIGSDVLIGCNSIILAGVHIGHGAVVAAGSVVVKDVPPYAIVGGNPAKVLRYRFSEEQVVALLKSEWWMREPDDLLPQMGSIARFLGTN